MASTENKEKLQALKMTLDRIEKTYGKGTIMRLGDSVIEPAEVISTGSLTLDLALGIGGYSERADYRNLRSRIFG